MTVMLALCMMSFLLFGLVLAEGTRIYFFKVKAAQAMDLAEFSVLSEYQKELFEEYGLFFLDLDYEQGKEQLPVLAQRAEYYLKENAEELETVDLCTKRICRMTDGDGSAFFNQAVEQRKVDSGYKLLEEILEGTDWSQQLPDLENMAEDYEESAEGILGQYADAEGMPLFDISLPEISFPSMDALTEAVLGNTDDLSQKYVDREDRLENRKLQNGEGNKTDISLTDQLQFWGYLFDHFRYYGDEGENQEAEPLRYQMEYIIFGESSDRENIEQMIWQVFVMRAGGNYLFYRLDPEIKANVELQAAAIAGVSGNADLIRLVREILFVKKAVEDGVSETRRIFAGEKVPFYQGGKMVNIKLGYEEYLYIGLMLRENPTVIYRAMDIVELAIRMKSGYQEFRMDHCTDDFDICWTFRFDGMFRGGFTERVTGYENTIEKRFHYET